MSTAPEEITAVAERPLVSGTSILLFSAFLAGIAFGQVLPRGAQLHVIAASSAGVIAYIGLWYTTLVKEQRRVTQVNEKVSRKLERKLGKHLSTRTDMLNGTTRRIDL